MTQEEREDFSQEKREKIEEKDEQLLYLRRAIAVAEVIAAQLKEETERAFKEDDDREWCHFLRRMRDEAEEEVCILKGKMDELMGVSIEVSYDPEQSDRPVDNSESYDDDYDLPF